ncbi:hypothetical protein [Bacillus thuringiensis]|uniref:Uncharacterized protein n=1 Tax=Bacillus thuringiensis TaxID=1428 RepID=A0A9X6WHY7_BACTU|nr:hypothetical protein [Bacillus thuringiensis]PFJ29030.1 hypothetical protein COJ15_32725 [Bacillus thuringiensis]
MFSKKEKKVLTIFGIVMASLLLVFGIFVASEVDRLHDQEKQFVLKNVHELTKEELKVLKEPTSGKGVNSDNTWRVTDGKKVWDVIVESISNEKGTFEIEEIIEIGNVVR